MVREIIKEGEDVLRKKCHKVEKFDEKLHILLDDMYETMQSANGVGLAGPQIGILRRVVVIDVGDGRIELINPEIVKTSGEQTGDEGCLSCPGKFGEVTRPMKVTVKAQDRFGNEFKIKVNFIKTLDGVRQVNSSDATASGLASFSSLVGSHRLSGQSPKMASAISWISSISRISCLL